jgi:hypothetical protein
MQDELNELYADENLEVQEGDNMTDATEFSNTPSLDVTKWAWNEVITNLDDEFKNESGHVAISKPGFEENSGKTVLLGLNVPLIARGAASAFASIRQGHYSLVTTGLLLLNSQAESNDAVWGYVMKTAPAQVVVDGELVDVPVPTEQGISFITKDPLLGYAEKYFVDLKWAFEVVRQKEFAMSPKQKYLATAFWKAYAAMAFASHDTVKIHVGFKTLNYVRKVLENVDNPEAAREAKDQAQFNQREYDRNREQIQNPTEDGSLRTKTGKTVAFDYKPKLVVVEQLGREVSKVAVIAETALDEATFLQSDAKEVAIIKRTEEGFGTRDISTRIRVPVQLATLYNIAAKDGKDLAIIQ